ncbi:MAG: hypothetical protein ACYTG1_11350 [Planctomycetota bacterium]|jgi:hypothetical protein
MSKAHRKMKRRRRALPGRTLRRVAGAAIVRKKATRRPRIASDPDGAW